MSPMVETDCRCDGTLHFAGQRRDCSSRLAARARALDIALRALRQIAREDYRGNRSSAAVTADRALFEIDAESL